MILSPNRCDFCHTHHVAGEEDNCVWRKRADLHMYIALAIGQLYTMTKTPYIKYASYLN
jgi:hypothetical protein